MDEPGPSLIFALVAAIDRQNKQMEQLAQAISQLAVSNESLVDAMLAPEPEEENEHMGLHLDGTRQQ